MLQWTGSSSLQWCHNERDGVWNHQHLNCLLNRLFRCRPKKTSMLCITGLCEVNFWVWVWVWVWVWIHRWPVDSPHKGPITRKMFDGVIMITLYDGLAPFVISIKNCNPTKFSPQSESSHGWIFCILSVDGQIVLLPPDGEVIYRSIWISVWWISNHTNGWVSAIKFWALFYTNRLMGICVMMGIGDHSVCGLPSPDSCHSHTAQFCQLNVALWSHMEADILVNIGSGSSFSPQAIFWINANLFKIGP